MGDNLLILLEMKYARHSIFLFSILVKIQVCTRKEYGFHHHEQQRFKIYISRHYNRKGIPRRFKPTSKTNNVGYGTEVYSGDVKSL